MILNNTTDHPVTQKNETNVPELLNLYELTLEQEEEILDQSNITTSII